MPARHLCGVLSVEGKKRGAARFAPVYPLSHCRMPPAPNCRGTRATQGDSPGRDALRMGIYRKQQPAGALAQAARLDAAGRGQEPSRQSLLPGSQTSPHRRQLNIHDVILCHSCYRRDATVSLAIRTRMSASARGVHTGEYPGIAMRAANTQGTRSGSQMQLPQAVKQAGSRPSLAAAAGCGGRRVTSAWRPPPRQRARGGHPCCPWGMHGTCIPGTHRQWSTFGLHRVMRIMRSDACRPAGRQGWAARPGSAGGSGVRSSQQQAGSMLPGAGS